MRLFAVLVFSAISAMLLAGCAGKADAPPTQSSPTSSATDATSAATTEEAPPPGPEHVLNATLGYYPPPDGNDPPVEFTVKPDGTSLELQIREIRRQGLTPTTLHGEPGEPGETTEPKITFTDPEGAVTEQKLKVVAGGLSNNAGQKIEEYTLTLQDPPAGAWSARIYGVGSNVDVIVTVIESFD